MNVSLIFWTLHLAVLPVYAWGSGSMQPSHMILLMALATSFLQRLLSCCFGFRSGLGRAGHGLSCLQELLLAGLWLWA